MRSIDSAVADPADGAAGIALVDAMMTLPFEMPASPGDPLIERRFGAGSSDLELDGLIAEMDAQGIELAIIGAGPVDFSRYQPGPYTVGTGVTDGFFDRACAVVARAIDAHPQRFKGFVYLDPSDCMGAVRRLERAVRDFQITIAHIMPSIVGLPPTHPTYFPVYAKCVELGVPLRVNIGQPGPSRRAELQRPMLLDEVLLTFPELMLVGAHLGYPWLDEVVALLRKYPNFHVMTSGWAPSRVPPEVWDCAKRLSGGGKLIWASDHPLLPIARCVAEGRDVPLEGVALQGYLGQNARRAFSVGA
jgi:predicted TIM-barrel fold metal-dependent hydrolase